MLNLILLTVRLTVEGTFSRAQREHVEFEMRLIRKFLEKGDFFGFENASNLRFIAVPVIQDAIKPL